MSRCQGSGGHDLLRECLPLGANISLRVYCCRHPVEAGEMAVWVSSGEYSAAVLQSPSPLTVRPALPGVRNI